MTIAILAALLVVSVVLLFRWLTTPHVCPSCGSSDYKTYSFGADILVCNRCGVSWDA